VDRALILGAFSPNYAKMTTQWLEAAKAAGVKHIVYFSALGVHAGTLNGPHGGPFTVGAWKWANEEFVRNNFSSWSIVQPSFFHDNLAKFELPAIKNHGQWSNSSNNGKTGFVDCRDISGVIVELLLNPEKHNKKSYELTGPAAISDSEQAEILSKYLGKPIKYVPITPEAHLKQLLGWGVPELIAKDLVTLDWMRAQGWTAKVTTAVKDVTGKDPIPFEQWAKDNKDLFKA